MKGICARHRSYLAGPLLQLGFQVLLAVAFTAAASFGSQTNESGDLGV